MSTGVKLVKSTTVPDVSLQKELETIGLSQRQAEVYLLLIANSSLRIQEIVRLTKLPRSSVYDIVEKLHEFGLVEEIIEDSFKRVRPYPVGAVRHLLNEKIAEMQSRVSSLSKLENALAILPEPNPSPVTVRYYKGRAGARQIFWNSLKAADTVYVLSSFGRSEFVGKKFYSEFVSQSNKKKIDEKVLTNPTQRALGLIKRDHGTPLARSDLNKIKLVSNDSIRFNGDTLIYNNIYAHIYFDAEQITGFEIESSHFVETQRSIFETLWRSAKPIKDFL